MRTAGGEAAQSRWGLEAVLERFIPVGRGVFAIYAPSPYVPVKVRRFVEMLEETFQPGRPHVRATTAVTHPRGQGPSRARRHP